MKAKIIFLFVVSFLLVAIQDSYSFPSDSLWVRLTLANKNISSYKGLVVNLKLQSKYRRSIYVPKYLSWGFLDDSSGTGYISLQVQKKEENVYKDVPLEGTIDNLPIIDKFDTLVVNSVKKESFCIGGTFKSDKGEYRVRVLCFASSYNHDVKDVFSNWVYFRCLKDVRRYNSRKRSSSSWH